METQKLELFAIIELFGHQRMAGKVSEQTVAGASMVRVDVPDTKISPAFTRFLNTSAIYAINPVTESVANEMAERIQSAPIQSWDVHKMHEKLLALSASKNENDFSDEN